MKELSFPEKMQPLQETVHASANRVQLRGGNSSGSGVKGERLERGFHGALRLPRVHRTPYTLHLTLYILHS